MAIQDIRLKIHHIDGDKTAAWEYLDTFMKCEVGTPMIVSEFGAASYKFGELMSREGDGVVKDIWISMGEYADGFPLEDVLSGAAGDDPSTLLSKMKTIPVVYVRNDMVLESVTYDASFNAGDRVAMVSNTLEVGGTQYLSWETKGLDTEDRCGTFVVIDAQPMAEGNELPQRLLLRYVG